MKAAYFYFLWNNACTPSYTGAHCLKQWYTNYLAGTTSATTTLIINTNIGEIEGYRSKFCSEVKIGHSPKYT